jgi:hypothetical protein
MSWLLFDSLMGGQGGTLEELETKRAPSFCRSEGAFLSVERKQTVYPQVLDSWMSHFDSQLQNCFVRDGKPEVPGLGVDVLSPGGRQDLHLDAVVPAVQDGGLRAQHEGLVSHDAGLVLLDVAASGGGLGSVDLDSRDELPRGDNFNVLVQDSGATLSERVLLHNDAALLGLDFLEEPAVGAHQVRAPVVDLVLGHHVQVPESSARTGGLSGEFLKLFDVKQKPLFALPSTSNSSMFIAASVSTISPQAVPKTTLLNRVVSTPSSSSTASTTSSSRASVLEEFSVPAFSKDGILGKAGESLSMRQIGEKSSVLVQEFVYNSVDPGTLKIYRYTWDLFRSYGKMSGVDVDKYSFNFLFICKFFLYRLQSTSSLSARSAISFMWKISFSLNCPTESNYVSLFIKGISRKFKQIPNKALL